jgi:hypothetical protein
MDWLADECKKLEDGLYKLESQIGGTPILFRDAMPNGGGRGEVIVLDDD